MEPKSSQSSGVRSQARKGETDMAELRPAAQTKGQEGTAQAVEAGAGILGRV